MTFKRSNILAFFEKALEAKVMSTSLLIRANVSKKVLLQAYKIATDFEARYSAYKPESYLNQINKNAGIQAISCTLEDYRLFSTAIQASIQTHGLFDITIGALSHATYHFGFENQALATDTEISYAKKLVNYKNIDLTSEHIYLKEKGMRLDLGGIGKGYVAKMIALFLEKEGASKLLVDVGGEIVTRGKSYTIALKDPFSEGYIGFIRTSKEDISISTSGDYIRYIDDKHHHILDTKQGNSPSYYHAMTIMQNGWNIDKLDAYATALYTLPSTQLIQEQKSLGIASIHIDHAGTISMNNSADIQVEAITFNTQG